MPQVIQFPFFAITVPAQTSHSSFNGCTVKIYMHQI